MKYAPRLMIVIFLMLAVTACVSDKSYNRAILKMATDSTMQPNNRGLWRGS